MEHIENREWELSYNVPASASGADCELFVFGLEDYVENTRVLSPHCFRMTICVTVVLRNRQILRNADEQIN